MCIIRPETYPGLVVPFHHLCKCLRTAHKGDYITLFFSAMSTGLIFSSHHNFHVLLLCFYHPSVRQASHSLWGIYSWKETSLAGLCCNECCHHNLEHCSWGSLSRRCSAGLRGNFKETTKSMLWGCSWFSLTHIQDVSWSLASFLLLTYP